MRDSVAAHTPAELHRIEIVKVAQIHPRFSSKWLADDAKVITWIGITVETRRVFRPAMWSACQHSGDEIARRQVRQQYEILRFELTTIGAAVKSPVSVKVSGLHGC